MKNGRAVVTILGFLAALVAGPAIAQDRGFYLGGTGGLSMFNEICGRTTVPCDDEDAGWRAFGGFQFNRNVSVEVGYAGFGEASGSGTAGSFTLEAGGMDLSAVFSFQVAGNLSAFGRVGAYRVKTILKQQGPFGSLSDSATNSGWVYGAGLGYTLWKLGLRAEYLQYANIGGPSTGKETVEMFGLTLLFRF